MPRWYWNLKKHLVHFWAFSYTFGMSPQKSSFRVLFLTPYLDQDILKGVADVAFENAWRLDATLRRQWSIPSSWDGEGIITGNFDTLPLLREFLEQHRHIPTVFVDPTEADWGASVVQNCDSQAQLAFEHLRQQGYRRFHFFQTFDDCYSRRRREAFLKILQSQGLPRSFSISSFEKLHAHELDDQLLKALRKNSDPLGIFCANDHLALLLAQACIFNDISIPERVGLVGVDNDPIETELAIIPISSVDNNRYMHGLKAAQTLQQLMKNRNAIAQQFVEPKGVLVRKSTQLSPMLPPVLRKAKALLATHFSNPKFRAQHLCEQLYISRRRLHDLFVAHYGMSAAELLLDYRIKCAEQLLQTKSLTVRQVAQQSGFAGPEYMSRVFNRQLGSRPSHSRLK